MRSAGGRGFARRPSLAMFQSLGGIQTPSVAMRGRGNTADAVLRMARGEPAIVGVYDYRV